MGQKGIVFTTQLSTADCSTVFRHAAANARGATARIAETAAKAMGNDQSGFFTPTFDSPFAAIDGTPDFAVGVHVAKLLNGAMGAGTTIHMYVDEAGGRRGVQIISPHTLTGG